MSIYEIFSLGGGVALFLYGMHIMGDGLERMSGGKLESILERLTDNKIRAVTLGAIVTAVLCTALGGYMRRRDDSARAGCYVPLRRWYLPASTTCGTLTMLAAAYIIYALGMQQGQTLYYTVYRIALTVFCIQAFASISRRLGRGAMRTGAQKAMLIGFAVLSLMGGALYLAIYGCASAVFGSRGALRPFIESKTKQ